MTGVTGIDGMTEDRITGFTGIDRMTEDRITGFTGINRMVGAPTDKLFFLKMGWSIDLELPQHYVPLTPPNSP